MNDLIDFDPSKVVPPGQSVIDFDPAKVIPPGQSSDVVQLKSDDILQMMQRPGYEPSDDDLRVVWDTEKNRGAVSQVGGFLKGAWHGLTETLPGQAKSSVKEIAQAARERDAGELASTAFATGADALYEGTGGLVDLGRRVARRAFDEVRNLGSDDETAFQRFASRMRANLAWQRNLEQGLVGPALAKSGQTVSQKNLPLPSTAAFVSNFADPSFLATAGAGSLLKGAARGGLRAGLKTLDAILGGRAVIDAAEKAANASVPVLEKVAKPAEVVAALPGQLAKGAVTATGKAAGAVKTLLRAPEAGLQKLPKALQVPLAAAAAGAVGLFPAYAKLKGAQTIAAGIEKGAEAVRRLLDLPPSQVPDLLALAKDTTAPPWLRRTASFMHNVHVGDVAQLVGDLAKSGAHGAAVGAGLGALAGETPEEAGEFAGIGAPLGVAGRGLRKVTGADAAARRLRGAVGDYASLLAHLKEQGAPDAVIKALTDHQAHVLSAYLNGAPGSPSSDAGFGLAASFRAAVDQRLKFRFLDNKAFAEAHPDQPNSGGSYEPGTRTISINVERNGGRDIPHELGHNLLRALGAEGHVRLVIDSVLGQDGVRAARSEYAQRLLQDDLRAAGQTGQPTPEQVAAKAAALDAGHKGDSWLYSEIYADAARHALRRDIMRDVLQPSLRRRFQQWASGDVMQSALKNGVPVDALFSNAEVYGPALRKMIYAQMRDLYQHGPGKVKGAGKETTVEGVKDVPAGIPVPPELAGSHPSVPRDTDGLVAKNGVLVFDARVARQQERDRKKAVQETINAQPAKPPGDASPEVAPRVGADGVREVKGTRVADQMAATGRFGETAVKVARQIEDIIATGTGAVARLWYQAIGSGARGVSWAKDILRRRGNIAVSQIDMAFYDFHTSANGNLLARGLSLTAMHRRLAEWAADPNSRLHQWWGGDERQFLADLDKYLQNHAHGQPGESNGIGVDKKNALNFFIVGRLAKLQDLNPLRVENANSLVRSLRLDRMGNLEQIQGAYPIDWEKQARNYSPAGEEAPAAYYEEDLRLYSPAGEHTEQNKEWTFTPSKDRAAMRRGYKEIRELAAKFPEAVVPTLARDKKGNVRLNRQTGRAKFAEMPYELVEAPLMQRLGDDKGAEVIASRLVREFERAMKVPKLAAGLEWYSGTRDRVRAAYGENADLFAQVMAVLSANNNVKGNFREGMTATRNFATGMYDDLVKRAAAYLEKNDSLKGWEEVPLKENGKRFSTQSKQVLRAFIDDWVKNVKRAVKTHQFYENMTGIDTNATVDVWMARMLRRILYKPEMERWRIPQEAEGKLTKRDFNFGQEVFRRAAKKLGYTPDQVQAVLWFAEKDLWARKVWTSNAGKVLGSFSEEFDKMAANAEPYRVQLGLTTYKTAATFDPKKHAGVIKRLRRLAKSQPGVMAVRSEPTRGYYEGFEPSIDFEATFDDPRAYGRMADLAVDIGRANKQNAVMISRVAPKETATSRPGIEFSFRRSIPKPIAELVLNLFDRAGVKGFTLAVNGRGRAVGFRAQYVPEFVGHETREARKAGRREWWAAAHSVLKELQKRPRLLRYGGRVDYETEINFTNP